MSVGVVEELKETLIDHVLCPVDKEQWQHVLPQTRNVFDVGPPESWGGGGEERERSIITQVI